MRKTLKIAGREYREGVRGKAFIIGLLLGPFFMGGGAIVFALFKDRVDTTDKRLAVVDRSGLVAGAVAKAAEERSAKEVYDPQTGEKVLPAYTVEIVTPDDSDPDAQRLALCDRVRRGELHGFVEIGPGVLHPRPDGPSSRADYYSKNPALDKLRRWVDQPVNDELRKLRLEEMGIQGPQAGDIFHWIGAEPLGLVSADPQTGQVHQAQRVSEVKSLLMPLALPGVMFLLIMMGAIPQCNSVVEEKSQRIAEVVLGSVRPFQFMMGKLIGGVSLALTATVVYVVTGIAALHYMELDQYIPYALLPWFVAYLVMAIFMFGAMFAAVGSACNDATEAQSLIMPVMLPVVFPFFVQMPVVMHPESYFSTGLSLFPLFTPMVMLMRQGTPGGIPLWQPCVGLLATALTTVFFVWASGRIFRVGILMQGTPPKLRNIVRWAFRD